MPITGREMGGLEGCGCDEARVVVTARPPKSGWQWWIAPEVGLTKRGNKKPPKSGWLSETAPEIGLTKGGQEAGGLEGLDCGEARVAVTVRPPKSGWQRRIAPEVGLTKRGNEKPPKSGWLSRTAPEVGLTEVGWWWSR